MKVLEQYNDEIYKCSRCGLCQSVCPVYEITKSETTVSRGFFSLLMGVLKGHLKFNKKIRKNLSACLHCNACKDYCPSGINPEEIMIAANIESFKFANPLKKMALGVIYSKLFLRLASLIRLYRYFPVLNFLCLGKVLHQFLKPNIKYKKLEPVSKSELKVAIFPGCINNYFNSSTFNALRMALELNGVEYIVPKEFECCTIGAYNTGDIKNFKKFARKNINAVSDDVDYVLFDCASCQKAFKVYAKVLDDEKSKQVAEKSLHINEFLYKENIEIKSSETQSVTYHKPCHLDCYDETSELMKNLNLDIKPIEEKCCGMAGLFSVDNLKISNILAKKKAQNMLSQSELALTDCPLCRIGIIKGAVLNGDKITVKQPIEVMMEKY